MTNEQLLQQAKDQIKPFQDEAVRRLGYGQSYFEFWVSSKSANNVEEVNSVAALLAIQSAREEGIEIIEEALACAPQDVDSVLKNGLKKLTAPGR